jgi:hypothetical protein
MKTRRITFLLTALVMAMAMTVTMGSIAFAKGGPPAGTIYAHDQQYKTIGTPTNLPDHGKFDTIYVLGGDLANVADAAPGDMEFNGGRWEVRPIEWLSISPTQFTNAEQVQNAADAGQISIGDVVKRFECPMIPKH